MTPENSLWMQCPLCKRHILREEAIDHGPDDCVLASHALQRYLEYERRADLYIKGSNPVMADRMMDRMDLLWFEMPAAERAWINDAGRRAERRRKRK